MKKVLSLTILISVIYLQGIAQDFSIETHIDTNLITIGDQVDLTYLIRHEGNLSVVHPSFEKNMLVEGVEILGEPLIEEKKLDNNKIEKTVSYKITSFDTGMYYLPPIPFLAKSQLFTDTVFSKATYLEVSGVELDTTNTVRDIKSIEKAPITFREAIPVILALIVLGLVIYIVYYSFGKKGDQGPNILKRVKPEEPPYYVALRELDKLKAEKVWQQKRTKEYYSRLTLIIRTYLEKRFLIPALEETTSEILNDFRNVSDAGIKLNEILRELLNLADLVKFAKGEPLPEDNIRLLENAYEFLKSTKPLEAETETTDTNNKSLSE